MYIFCFFPNSIFQKKWFNFIITNKLKYKMDLEKTKIALVENLRNYKNDVLGYSEADFNHKQSPEIWSIGQMYEHLTMSANHFFLKNIKYCFEQRNGQLGGQMNSMGENVFKYNSFPPIKVKVPGNAPDPLANNQNYYFNELEKIAQQVESQFDSLATNDGLYKTQHPAFSWHNATEWFASFEMHHRHHLRQKAELEEYIAAKK